MEWFKKSFLKKNKNMKKRKTLRDLLFSIAQEISPPLSALDYKYLKTKYRFVLKKGDFNQNFGLAYVPFQTSLIEEQHGLTANISLTSFIDSPKFHKWLHRVRTSGKHILEHRIDRIATKVPLKNTELQKKDFDAPYSAARQFKRNLAKSFIGKLPPIPEVDFEILQHTVIQKLHQNFEGKLDANYLFENRMAELEIKYIDLLYFFGEKEKAIFWYKKAHEYKITQQTKYYEKGHKALVKQEMTQFNTILKNITGLDFDNPFV